MKLANETALDEKIHGRWYQDACGAAFAMELIGERWSLPVIRELMLGGRRFSDIRASLPGISAKVLTERLDRMEKLGIVVRKTIENPVPAKLYDLTAWGLALEPVMQELGRWSTQSSGHDPMLPLTPVSLMLSMRTMLKREPARELTCRVLFEVGADVFLGEMADGELRIVRSGREAKDWDIRFSAPHANAYLASFYGKQPIGSPGNLLEAEGSHDLIERFIACFALPKKRVAVP